MLGECFRRVGVFLRKEDPLQGKENGNRKGIGKRKVFMGIISAYIMVVLLGLRFYPTPRCIWKNMVDVGTKKTALAFWCPRFNELDRLSVLVKLVFGLELPFHPDLYACNLLKTDRMPQSLSDN